MTISDISGNFYYKQHDIMLSPEDWGIQKYLPPLDRRMYSIE